MLATYVNLEGILVVLAIICLVVWLFGHRPR